MTDGRSIDARAEMLAWRAIEGQVLEVRRHSSPYRPGYVKNGLRDGIGLLLAADGSSGWESIWEGRGFTAHALVMQDATGSLQYREEQVVPSAEQPVQQGHSK